MRVVAYRALSDHGGVPVTGLETKKAAEKPLGRIHRSLQGVDHDSLPMSSHRFDRRIRSPQGSDYCHRIHLHHYHIGWNRRSHIRCRNRFDRSSPIVPGCSRQVSTSVWWDVLRLRQGARGNAMGVWGVDIQAEQSSRDEY